MARSRTSSSWRLLRRGAAAIALAITLAAACSSGDERAREQTRAPKRGDGGANTGSVPSDAIAPLLVTVNGRDAPPWTAGAFERVERWSIRGDNGSPRAVWSLPKLATKLVGPNARVVRLHSDDATLALSLVQWRALDAIPALRRTGRGELKFQLIDVHGRPHSRDVELPRIVRIEVVLDEQQRKHEPDQARHHRQ